MRNFTVLAVIVALAGMSISGQAGDRNGQLPFGELCCQERSGTSSDSLGVECVGKALSGPCWAAFVGLERRYAYIGGGGCLLILDITDPSNPVLTGKTSTPGLVWGIHVSGGQAYVADGEHGLRIINVSDASNPYEEGFYDTEGYARGVVARGRYAYVADFEEGLRIINVTDPSNPYEEGFFDTGGRARGVFVKDNYAYVADGQEGLRIINVSDPANP